MVEKDLGQIIPDVTATATIDDTVGTPEVNITVEELEELGRLVNKFKFNFLHLKGEKGDKPQKGVDYYTTQEKEQFTAEAKALVTGEGTKQVSLINAETAKVIQQVKEIVAGNAATTNALTLNGKTRLEFEKEIQGLAGGYNGIFPLKKAELNGIYLFPSTGKLYVCIKNYNGSQLTAPNANFEELSVYTNRSKLDNLCKSKSTIIRVQPGAVQVANIPYPDGYDWNNCRVIPVCIGSDRGSVPPLIKINETEVITFNNTVWFDILLYFFKIY